MDAPRVLVVLDTNAAWSRGILRGFMAEANQRGWTLLHYHPNSSLSWLAAEWTPAVTVIGPALDSEAVARLAPASLVSVTVDRSHAGIASVCPDEHAIAALALAHLLSTGLRDVTTFRFDESPFAVARERAFVEGARAAGARVAVGWGSEEAASAPRAEDPAAMTAWVRSLPRPCGVFTCTDGWARAVERYARVAGLRIPEDLALIGANNDELECELMSPPLSSVMIPWQELGRHAAILVARALEGHAIAGERVAVAPTSVVARRSSDVIAIGDELVAEAVRFIRENSERRLTVTMVARAVGGGGGRQRLERRFRSVLDRTVQAEIRRAHVETAKRLLDTTRLALSEVARRSGFTSAALLNAAFQREFGVAPGAYRRRVRRETSEPDER
jgi:LacI family transcriptional regulator